MNGLLSIFFAQTRLIWNILSTYSKHWHMGYISHSIFIPGHKFVVEIANSYQIWNLEITLVLKLTILMGISKSCICLYFSILTTNLCPGMKIEWEIYPICQCLEHVLKIFQIRRICAKKIDNNPCTFLVPKVAFSCMYYPYKLCFFFIPYQ